MLTSRFFTEDSTGWRSVFRKILPPLVGHHGETDRGPTCDEIFSMLEATIMEIERGHFVDFDLYFHMSYSDLKMQLSRKSYSPSKFRWLGQFWGP